MSHDTMNCGFSEHSNREKKIDIQGNSIFGKIWNGFDPLSAWITTVLLGKSPTFKLPTNLKFLLVIILKHLNIIINIC